MNATVNLTPETPAEVTQAEFAKLRGVKPPLITRWKQRGMLVMSDDGLRVRVRESLARLDSGLHPGRGGDRRASRHADPASKPGEARADYSTEAAREKRASAQLKEIELAERAGQVLAAQHVRDATLRRVQAAKSAMLALPRRIAPKCALETDPLVIERLLLAEMRTVFAALATGVDQHDQPAEAA